MVTRLVVRLLILSGAMWLVAWLLPDITIEGGFFTYLWIAVVFALVNAIIGPVLRLLALPLPLLTLGLFALVVNAGLLGITAALSSDFAINGFWGGPLFGALVISVVTAVLNVLLPGRVRRR